MFERDQWQANALIMKTCENTAEVKRKRDRLRTYLLFFVHSGLKIQILDKQQEAVH